MADRLEDSKTVLRVLEFIQSVLDKFSKFVADFAALILQEVVRKSRKSSKISNRLTFHSYWAKLAVSGEFV